MIDIAFFGTEGIDLSRGYTGSDPEAARFTTIFQKPTAKKIVILADKSKIGVSAPFVYVDFKNTTLITEELAPNQRETLSVAGVDLQEVSLGTSY